MREAVFTEEDNTALGDYPWHQCVRWYELGRGSKSAHCSGKTRQ